MILDTKALTEKVGLADHLSHLDQVGIICADFDKAVESMRNVFGWEPDVVYERTFPWQYRGEDENMSSKICAYRNHFPIELEFIQPTGGRSAWQDYLDMGQFGLHHLRFNVRDFWGAYQALLDAGLTVWITGPGTGPEGLRSAYFDGLDALGFVVEIINWHEVNGD